MKKDIDFQLQKCKACLRNKKTRSFYNDAYILKVTGLFDLVGLDLQFGYPESTEGYTGMLVLTEYVSKYVFAFPIRSKTAEEVFRRFLEYVCFFGPPRCILTDCGKEFMNEIFAKFTTAVGIVHRRIIRGPMASQRGLTPHWRSLSGSCVRRMAQVLAIHYLGLQYARSFYYRPDPIQPSLW